MPQRSATPSPALRRARRCTPLPADQGRMHVVGSLFRVHSPLIDANALDRRPGAAGRSPAAASPSVLRRTPPTPRPPRVPRHPHPRPPRVPRHPPRLRAPHATHPGSARRTSSRALRAAQPRPVARRTPWEASLSSATAQLRGTCCLNPTWKPHLRGTCGFDPAQRATRPPSLDAARLRRAAARGPPTARRSCGCYAGAFRCNNRKIAAQGGRPLPGPAWAASIKEITPLS
jgi:hypothetical protein